MVEVSHVEWGVIVVDPKGLGSSLEEVHKLGQSSKQSKFIGQFSGKTWHMATFSSQDASILRLVDAGTADCSTMGSASIILFIFSTMSSSFLANSATTS